MPMPMPMPMRVRTRAFLWLTDEILIFTLSYPVLIEEASAIRLIHPSRSE
jgi:hypothetical protein